ncbi:hypothetical protein BDN71DRAFT_1451940 [Pleurotus eryngii]|uniref:Uncharacterized protein n=1 Tax=Pleurotus eryngii TaxID=5323 RepID=A0A9P5ZQK6_PLEER|nr:hypothetical protein BDN71DRAFT_1451940 [Pleurotus eryngii]
MGGVACAHWVYPFIRIRRRRSDHSDLISFRRSATFVLNAVFLASTRACEPTTAILNGRRRSFLRMHSATFSSCQRTPDPISLPHFFPLPLEGGTPQLPTSADSASTVHD